MSKIKILLLSTLGLVPLQAQEITDLPWYVQEHHHSNKYYLAERVDTELVYTYTKYVKQHPLKNQFIIAVANHRDLIDGRKENFFALVNYLSGMVFKLPPDRNKDVEYAFTRSINKFRK